MNYPLFFLIIILSNVGQTVFGEHLTIETKGEAVILMNAHSSAILYEKEPDRLRFPASTTKVATALYALKLKEDALEQVFTAENDALISLSAEAKNRLKNNQIYSYRLEPDGSHINLRAGESLRFKDLLAGLLIASGNDAANVIAQSIGSTVPKFMDGLNDYLKTIGCVNTHFCNPHGLHHPLHQTTALDLAIMTKEALNYPTFRELVSQSRYIRPKTNKQNAMTLVQTNRLIRPGKFQYAKAIGVKTGYHSKAKHNLVAAAQYQERLLIGVFLGYQERNTMFEEAIQLFERAFNQPKIQRQFLQEGLQKFIYSFPKASVQLQTYLNEPFVYHYYPAEDPQAKCFLHWKNLQLPIAKNDIVAEVHLVSAKGETLKTIPVLAFNSVDFDWMHNPIYRTIFYYSLVILIGLLVLKLIKRMFF